MSKILIPLKIKQIECDSNIKLYSNSFIIEIEDSILSDEVKYEVIGELSLKITKTTKM